MATALEVREIVIRVKGAGEAAEAYRDIAAEGDKATAETAALGKAAKKSGAEIKTSLGEKAASVFRGIGTAAAAAAAVAAGAFVKLGFDTVIAQEKGLNALTAVMGSAEGAKAELEKLRRTAELPSVDLTGAIRISAQLQAIGATADEARTAIATMANEVTKSGGGTQELEEVSRSVSSAIARGKIEAEDLNEIRSRMYGVATAMKALGATTAKELNDMFGGAKGAYDAIFKWLEKNSKKVEGGLALAIENAKIQVGELAKEFVSGLLGLDKGVTTEQALIAITDELGDIGKAVGDLGSTIGNLKDPILSGVLDSLKQIEFYLNSDISLLSKFLYTLYLIGHPFAEVLTLGKAPSTEEFRDALSWLEGGGADRNNRPQLPSGRGAVGGAVAGQVMADALSQYDRTARRQTNRQLSRVAAESG